MSLATIAPIIVNSLHLEAPSFTAPDEAKWPLLLHHADGHTLTPLLYAVWRERGWLDQVPPPFRARLAQAHADNSQRQALVRAELLEIDQLLTEAEVPHLVLKGWPLVERLYADPAERLIRDHDFLVPADRAEAGYRALREAGFHPLPGGDRWVEKHLPPLWRNDGYVWSGYLFDPHHPRPVELHTRLWDARWRGLAVSELPDLWTERRTSVVAGVPLMALSDEHTLIHLCQHFAGHWIEREARLSQLLDLARFVVQADGLDWQRLVAQAGRAGVARFVFTALFLAHEVFGSPRPLPVWPALEAETPPALRRWLAAHGVGDVITGDYRRRHKGKDYQFARTQHAPSEAENEFEARGRDYQLTWLAARTPRERLGVLRFAALPPAAQLMEKYRLRHRWQAALLYPRHVAERLSAYGRAWWRHQSNGGSAR